MDAINLLSLKYVSFSGLGWFDDQLREGDSLMRRINNNNKRVRLLGLS